MEAEVNGTAGPEGTESARAGGGPDGGQGDEYDVEVLDDGRGGCDGSAGNGPDGAEWLRAKVLELEKALAEERDKNMRLLADFQNHRNRSAREVRLGVEQAERQILLEALQVLDSFRRCLGSGYASVEDFRAGVGLIERQFDGALRRFGVTEIDVKAGDAFDPNVAEGLTRMKTADFPPGSVVDVCERGYRVGERLLRPAKVVVAEGDDAP